jgi:hypothetical protein
MKGIRKYWGYVVILLVIYGWSTASLGAGVLAVLSLIAFLYTLFQAPVWCCAETRQGQYCRNNANGILVGCWIREHRWQKLKMLIKLEHWKQLFGRLFSGINGAAATLASLGTFLSGVAALVALK